MTTAFPAPPSWVSQAASPASPTEQGILQCALTEDEWRNGGEPQQRASQRTLTPVCPQHCLPWSPPRVFALAPTPPCQKETTSFLDF